MKPKSTDTLLDFLKFCLNNPHLRFWQALQGWTGKAIKIGNEDPYYWEDKEKP